MDFNGTLENGAELYTCLNPNLRGFCLSLWVRRGSMHEPEDAHGLTHFLEHATFRSISERMAGQLYPTLTRLGLNFDASTYTNYVRFEMSGLAEDFDTGLDILLMALDPPTLSLDGIDRERRRIQTEIREEDAQESAEAFANAAVWRGTQLARSIAGTNHSTNLIGFDALREEHARWFAKGGFFFCATGNVPDIGALKARLGALVPGPAAPVFEAAPVPPAFFHRDARVEIQDRSYTWVRFSFDVDTRRYSEMAFISLMEYLLGDMGALYMALSEDTGIVYNLDDCFDRYSNIGCMSFEFEVEPQRLNEAIDIVVETLKRSQTASDEALDDARLGGLRDDGVKQDHICSFNNAWGYDNGIKHSGFTTLEARAKAYASIDPETVRAIAREVFRPDNAVLCIRGNKRRIKEEAIREMILRLGSEGKEE